MAVSLTSGARSHLDTALSQSRVTATRCIAMIIACLDPIFMSLLSPLRRSRRCKSGRLTGPGAGQRSSLVLLLVTWLAA